MRCFRRNVDTDQAPAFYFFRAVLGTAIRNMANVARPAQNYNKLLMPVEPAPYLPYQERLDRLKRLLAQWKEAHAKKRQSAFPERMRLPPRDTPSASATRINHQRNLIGSALQLYRAGEYGFWMENSRGLH
jgi:hypothetical protein